MILDELKRSVLNCAKGSYQLNLLDGAETWSGSSLTGTARRYGIHYMHSRKHLLERICKIPDIEATTKMILLGSPRRWRRELVITYQNKNYIFRNDLLETQLQESYFKPKHYFSTLALTN